MSRFRTLTLLIAVFVFGLLMASFGEYRAQFDTPIITLMLVLVINLTMIGIVKAIITLKLKPNHQQKRQERINAVLKQLSDEDIIILRRELQYLRTHSQEDFDRLETMN